MKEEYPRLYLYKRVVQAKLFIDAHFAEPIDLAHVSGEARFSRYHFLRLFKAIYGETPHRYLTCTRIRNAQQLLREDHTVSEACFAVGFESLSTFTGLFKRWVGITPSAYREQQKMLRAEMKDVPLKYIPFCFANMHAPAEKQFSRNAQPVFRSSLFKTNPL